MSTIGASVNPTERKKFTLWSFTGIRCAIGVLDAALPGRVQSWPGISYFLVPVLFTLFIYTWALNDAKEDGRVIAGKMSLFLLLIPALGLPVYVIRNKSPKKMLILFFGFLILVPPVLGYAFLRAATAMILER